MDPKSTEATGLYSFANLYCLYRAGQYLPVGTRDSYPPQRQNSWIGYCFCGKSPIGIMHRITDMLVGLGAKVPQFDQVAIGWDCFRQSLIPLLSRSRLHTKLFGDTSASLTSRYQLAVIVRSTLLCAPPSLKSGLARSYAKPSFFDHGPVPGNCGNLPS